MKKNMILTTQVTLNVPVSKVWKAVTDPAIIRKYMFGTEVETDWKAGSPISWQGEWEGKKYKDKGEIIKVEKNKLLAFTYWSSMQGKEDKPENYAQVTYRLKDLGGRTLFILTQDHIESEKSKAHSRKNWRMMFTTMKQVLEK